MSDGWTYEYSFPVPAPADRIFSAWTSEAELEHWFAERARIEPREGGRFEFWGRHTVGTPAEGEAGGAITAFRADERIEFEWELFGAPSMVTITLEAEEPEEAEEAGAEAGEGGEGGSVTRVAIAHAFERLFEGPRAEELVDDWWRFTLGNLAAHVTGRGEVMRVDFADDSPEIRLDMHVEASPETVFRALTEPAALNQWMAKDAKVELEVGGSYDLGWAPEGYEGPGMEILELEPDRKITISWPDWRGDTSVPQQSVSWILEPSGGGTKVTLIHAGFVRAVDLSDYPFGWGHFMSRLKPVAEAL